MAPWPIDKQAKYQKYAHKKRTGQPQIGGFVYFKGIEWFYNVDSPGKSDNRKGPEKNETDAVGKDKRRLDPAAQDCFPLTGLIELKNQILKNADLAAPCTNVFV